MVHSLYSFPTPPHVKVCMRQGIESTVLLKYSSSTNNKNIVTVATLIIIRKKIGELVSHVTSTAELYVISEFLINFKLIFFIFLMLIVKLTLFKLG